MGKGILTKDNVAESLVKRIAGEVIKAEHSAAAKAQWLEIFGNTLVTRKDPLAEISPENPATVESVGENSKIGICKENKSFVNSQLESPEAQTDFEENVSQNLMIPLREPLRKLPNGTTDRIFKDTDGLWKAERKIYSYDISENPSLTIRTSDNETISVYTGGLPYRGKYKNIGICTHFHMGNGDLPDVNCITFSGGVWDGFNNINFTMYNSTLGITSTDTDEQKLAKVKEWLTINHPTVDYVVTELPGYQHLPVETLHPDTQVVLDELSQMYAEQTVIRSTDKVSPTFELEYLQDITNGYMTAKDKSLLNELLEKNRILTNQISDLQACTGYMEKDIFGVEVDFANNRFIRLAGAAGKIAGEDFDTINCFGGRRRCNVTDEGKVLAYYGEAGYSETGALTQAITKNGVTYPAGTIVQVMVEQPKFYYKVVPLELEAIQGGKGYHLRKGRWYISDTEKNGFKLHPAFICNGVEKDFIYLAAYEGCLWDASAAQYILDDAQVADFNTDMLASIAGARPVSGLTQRLTRANTRNLAQKRGAGWQQAYAATVAVTQLLFLVEHASFNMQERIGMGATQKTDVNDGASGTEITGATSSLGNATGSVDNVNGVNIVTYRGEENFYGNIFRFVDGMNINAKGIHELYVTDHDFADNKIADNYKNAGITLAKTDGFVSAFGYNEEYDWLFIASETKGNSSFPVGDYFWQYNRYNGIMNVTFGAPWGNGVLSGGFAWSMVIIPASYGRSINGRLTYVPQ